MKITKEFLRTIIKEELNRLSEAVQIGDFNFDDQAAALINQEVGSIQNLTVDIVGHSGGNVTERDGMLFYNGLKFEPSQFVKLLKNPNFDKLITQKKSINATQSTNQQQSAPQQQSGDIKQKLTNALLEKNPNGIGRKNQSLVDAFKELINNYLNGIWSFYGIRPGSMRVPNLEQILKDPSVANIVSDTEKTKFGGPINPSVNPKEFDKVAANAYDLFVLIGKNLKILSDKYKAAGEIKFYNDKIGPAAKAYMNFYQIQQKLT